MYFDKDFNLIIDINENIQACVKPITRKFFESHYKIFKSLAIRFNRQADEDQALLINQTALLDLKDVAGEEKSGEIIDEINRTTLISIACGEKSKKPLVLDIAFEKKMIDLDEFNETLSLIIFFTVVLLIVPQKSEQALKSFLACPLIHSTSLNYIDYLKSSGTSKTEGTTDGKMKISSL